ncbi:MAG: TIR domain-containing protein [Alphaproteobacteria bacterium]|nr:TIR domain-containing protein [Alphaproteobacteria bacterium]
MATQPFEYWQPGSEERQLRLFISHRWDHDESLYGSVINALNRQGFIVQDMSLSKDQAVKGPRGGSVAQLKIQAEIAARIFTSDILIAPSRVATTSAEWLTWEIQLAAIGYGLPVLFVDQTDQKHRTRLVSEMQDLGAPHAVCEPDTTHIVRAVTSLVSGRPTWAMRQDEPDTNFRFRGPPRTARYSVLRRFPFQPRLRDMRPPPKPPSFLDRMFGRGGA